MPTPTFDEKLLQDYKDQIQKHATAILRFTSFLESKRYPGSSQFNYFLLDLERQIKKTLVDEDFIKEMQEIDDNISKLQKCVQINQNPLLIHRIKKLMEQKDILAKDQVNRLNKIKLSRIRAIQAALSTEFYDCFVTNIPEHNIPLEVNAAFTLIESQLKYLQLYMLIVDQSIAAIDSIPSIMGTFYSITPYYRFDIPKYTQPSTTSNFTRVTKAVTGMIPRFITDRVSSLAQSVVTSKVHQQTDRIFLATDEFEIKLKLLQEHLEKNHVIEKEGEKLETTLGTKLLRSLRFVTPEQPENLQHPISSSVLELSYDSVAKYMDLFKRYLNVNLPISIDSLYDIYQQQSKAFAAHTTEVAGTSYQPLELENLSIATLEMQVSKLVDLSQLILKIIQIKHLTGNINDRAQQDLLNFINHHWKEWNDLKNSVEYHTLSTKDKRGLLESMIKTAYQAIYGIAYLNKHEKRNIDISLLEIFSQKILDCLSISTVSDTIIEAIEPEFQKISRAKTLSLINTFNPMVNAAALHQLDLILRKMEHYANTDPLLRSATHPQSDHSSKVKFASNPHDRKHISIQDKLFLYSSGGGGHREAKNARVAEAIAKDHPNPTFKPLEQDLMLDWVPLGIGKWSTDQWNDAQKRGDVPKQEELVSQQYLADLFFGPFIYQKAYKLLEDNPNLKEIVDTQAVCNKAVCQAVIDINKKYNRNVKISLTMTDLPTDRAVHFWNGLRTLTEQERSVITVECMEPLIPEKIRKYLNTDDKDKQLEEFFAMFCGPGLNIIINNQPPIRKEFLAANHRSKEQINQDGYLSFKYKFPDEQEILANVPGSMELRSEKTVRIPVQANDIVLSVLLGSQGGQAIVEYVREAIRHFEKPISGGKVILCLYCSADKEQSSKIFRDIKKILDEHPEISKDLIILPVGMQDATTIAENLERDNVAITRTGGIASFEALIINQDKPRDQQTKFLLHSESKGHTKEELLSSIPVWERGNAEYLMHKLDAQVVNTVNFKQEYLIALNPPKYAHLAKLSDQPKTIASSTQTLPKRSFTTRTFTSRKQITLPGSGVTFSLKSMFPLKSTKKQQPQQKMFPPQLAIEQQPQQGWNCFDIATQLAKGNYLEAPIQTRTHFVKFALDHSNDPEFRKLLLQEIKSAFMISHTNNFRYTRFGLPRNMLQNKPWIREAKQKYEDYLASLVSDDPQIKKHYEDRFDHCFTEEKIYKEYVQGYYGDQHDWFVFLPYQDQARRATSMIDIAAKYIGKNINIYQRHEGKLTLIHSTNLDNHDMANTVHVEFLGGNHFINVNHEFIGKGRQRGFSR